MDYIEDIQLAFEMLCRGEILIAIESRTILYRKEKMIYAKQEYWHSAIQKEDFFNLFKNQTFKVYEPKEEEISKEKDEEYYQWRQRYL